VIDLWVLSSRETFDRGMSCTCELDDAEQSWEKFGYARCWTLAAAIMTLSRVDHKQAEAKLTFLEF
jgi:hypothetical protein